MKIKVRYTAQLKKAISKREAFVEVNEGILVTTLLNLLNEQNRKAFTNIVFNENGEFLNAVLIILNGKQISINYTDLLKDNDEITIMSPIAGG